MKNETAQHLVTSYGQQAYHRAVLLTVMAEKVGDREGAREFADAAIELMQVGYHKHQQEAIDDPTQ